MARCSAKSSAAPCRWHRRADRYGNAGASQVWIRPGALGVSDTSLTGEGGRLSWRFGTSCRIRRSEHQTHARKDGDDYVINGSKMWTTNGTQADWICLLAIQNKTKGAPEQDVDLRANGHQGISVAQRFNKLGCGHRIRRRYFLTTCAFRGRTGSVRKGMASAIRWSSSRGANMGSRNVLRQLERVIRLTREYCSQRSVFNRHLSEFQVIQFPVGGAGYRNRGIRSVVYGRRRTSLAARTSLVSPAWQS